MQYISIRKPEKLQIPPAEETQEIPIALAE